jgi:hypothetical protein
MRKPARGGYVYPFGPKTTTGRIDQGQDFGGSGPVRAIGRAQILRTRSPWPEYEHGAGILYRLLEGPYAGKVVYVYEGVKAQVRPGQIVEAGQTIGQIIPNSSSGIETGWADPRTGQPISAAEYTEGKKTRAGKAFSRFLGGLKSSGEGGDSGHSSFGPLGTLEEAIEGDISPIPGFAEGPVKSALGAVDLTGEIIKALQNPETLMLNVALVGGGAFLIYYGAALMLGVKKPVATPAKMAAIAGGA